MIATPAGAHPCAATHGGPDALGVARCDLSSNGNPCDPFPAVLQALAQLDWRHYPDPAYTRLVGQLADWHGVAPQRILPAASASEFIQRISMAVRLAWGQGAAVWLPQHAYGDYARAMHAAGLSQVADARQARLLWACEPSSPHGQLLPDLPEQVAALQDGQALVLDQAYAPLQLEGSGSLHARQLDGVWRLITPNKALGLTGIRAAYALAPENPPADLLRQLRHLQPSWPVGAAGVAMLQVWATEGAQHWLDACREHLRAWKQRQIGLLQGVGWSVQPGQASFFVARPPPVIGKMPDFLAALRRQGFKLRDCSSFGLPGAVRMAVATLDDQDELLRALQRLGAA